MKRLLIAAVAAAFVLSLAGSLLADDFAPPAWRGSDGSTSQAWEFLSDAAQDVVPDVYSNPYGEPSADIVPAPATGWLDWYAGRDGVWPLSGSIEATIQNLDEENPYKDIYIQLTWAQTACPSTPFVWEVRFDKDATLVSQVQVPGTEWYHSIYTIRLEPNPDWEIVKIQGDIYVDEVVIDTRCVVPEPTGLLVLLGGVGSLTGMFLRRRK